MTALPDITFLGLADSPRLADLPPDVFRIIFSFLDTAQSLAHLGLTCKRLNEVVMWNGWRTFVKSQFRTLVLPEPVQDDEWVALAKKLTWQSRGWDRRAFLMALLLPPAQQDQPLSIMGERGRGRGRGRGRSRGRGREGGGSASGRPQNQTLPPQTIVDACLERKGNVEEETLVWGLGEDIVARWRHSHDSLLKGEVWRAMDGAQLGFRSGRDDVTAMSILQDASGGQTLLVGRANGQLQLLSANQTDFGQIVASFQHSSPNESENTLIKQSEIQHFSTSAAQKTAVVITKSNMLVYPLPNADLAAGRTDSPSGIVVEAAEALDIRGMPGSTEFMSLRQVCFMGDGNLALCMNRSTDPLRYVVRTPAGSTLMNAAKMRPSVRCKESLIYDGNHLHNARGLLPVNMASVPGGSGGAVLSSYDDGTVRLQDVRTPSPFDAIYQDHFELVAPMGSLVAHGMDRFIAGSARAAVLKIFDFRWNKRYYYTEALPCSDRPLEPKPKSLTDVLSPVAAVRDKCCHIYDRPCALHYLARTDFYRPNCTAYLPALEQTAGPVYSLAKPSDFSAVIYAGLTKGLAEISLRDHASDPEESSYIQHIGNEDLCGYSYREELCSLVETGDGIGLADISKSKRLPALFKQKRSKLNVASDKLARLDAWLM